jgi:hypothetical protein
MPEEDQSGAKLPSSVDQSGSKMPALDQSGIAVPDVEATGRPEDSVSEGIVEEMKAGSDTTEVLQEADLPRNSTRNRLRFIIQYLKRLESLTIQNSFIEKGQMRQYGPAKKLINGFMIA